MNTALRLLLAAEFICLGFAIITRWDILFALAVSFGCGACIAALYSHDRSAS